MVNTSARQNNFDFIRFAAATLVWFGHCFTLYDYNAPIRALGLQVWGVHIFFIISGYLVTWSYLRHINWRVFVKNRVLRIYPGLAVTVLWGTFLVGPLITLFSLHDYFSSRDLWQRFFSCILLTQIDLGSHFWSHLIASSGVYLQLPGVFSDSSHALEIFNGSLWTIPLEVRCYGAIVILGLLRGLKILPVLFLVFLLFYCSNKVGAGPTEWAMWDYISFALGALFYLARDTIRFNGRYLIFFLLLFSVVFWAPANGLRILLCLIALTYIVLWFAFLKLPHIGSFGKYGDFSYGIYLFAWPVQQLCLSLLSRNNFPEFMVLSFVITFVCALVSWFLIEKPALYLKESSIRSNLRSDCLEAK